MKDKRENHPNIITDVVEMPEANSTVEIYRGEYFIKNEKYNIRVKGRITYDWFPSIGVRFYGNINNDENEIRFLKSNNTYYCNVFIDGLKLGKGIIRRLKIETTPKGTIYTLAGIISGSAIHGDKSICADKITQLYTLLYQRFCIITGLSKHKKRICWIRFNYGLS
jgi:hypothetical protein